MNCNILTTIEQPKCKCEQPEMKHLNILVNFIQSYLFLYTRMKKDIVNIFLSIPNSHRTAFRTERLQCTGNQLSCNLNWIKRNTYSLGIKHGLMAMGKKLQDWCFHKWGTPKSSILMKFSPLNPLNHPFRGTPICGNPQIGI